MAFPFSYRLRSLVGNESKTNCFRPARSPTRSMNVLVTRNAIPHASNGYPVVRTRYGILILGLSWGTPGGEADKISTVHAST